MSDTSFANSNNNNASPNGDELARPIQGQIIEIPLDQILLNDKNPRGFIDPGAVDTLKASMAIEGQKTPIKTRQLSEAEIANLSPNPEELPPDISYPKGVPLYRVVGGDHRLLAARKLGWKTIKGMVLDIIAEESFLEGYLDNQGKEMGWFSDFKAAEALWNQNQDPKKTQKAVADRLMKSEALVSMALKLLPLLNSSAREALLHQVKKSPKDQVTQKAIYRLTDLATGGNADTYRIWAALKVVLDRQMTEAQVQKLVAWIQKGNSPESFPASGKTEVQKGSKNQRFDPNDPLADIWKGLPKGAKIHKTPKGYQLSWKLSEAEAPLAVKGALAWLTGTKGENPNSTVADPNQPLSPQNPGPNTSILTTTSIVPQAASTTKIYVFRDLMSGVNVIHKIQQKIAKGETPTLLESLVLGGYRIGQGIDWLWKEMIKPSLEKFKKTFGKTIYYIFIALILFFVAWKVWPVFQAVLHPIHWIESKFHHDQTIPESTPVSTPMASTILPKVEVAITHLMPEKKTVKLTPAMVYQPAISFQPTVEDPKVLETEIAAIPFNSLVKNFPLTPDEGMPVDLATSRMQDLTDADKYTMMIGGGKQIILLVNTTNTNLTIHYKSADPLGGLLGDNGLLNFFWEDVKAIHVSEIDVRTKTPSVIYQCSLIVSGSKNPLIIQCASADDLQHLVSTIEFFIRCSRLGHDTPLTGMPYPSQGLRLTGDCLVEKLWANSPMDKTGVKLGDMIWGVDKNAQDPPDRKKLETQLAALTPGQHALYIANNADYTQAQNDISFGRSRYLNPKRHKVILNAL